MINLTAPRVIQNRYLTEAATIARYTETSTSDGVIQDWTPIASGVPCRVSQPSTAGGVERPGDGTVLRALSEWRIWLPFDTDVTERDRITVTAADRVDGRTFEVTRVDEKSFETARRCFCSLVT